MVEKQAIRKQQNISRTQQSSTQEPEAPLDVLRRTAEACRACAEECVESADVEAVHRVRSGSRRVQAIVEVVIAERSSANSELPRAARRWLRQLKRVRRAAAPVRDLDVHQQLLQKWLGGLSPDDDLALRPHAEELLHFLRDERWRKVLAMQRELRSRRERLEKREWAFFARAAVASADPASAIPRSTDLIALESYVRTAEEMQLLDASNLHDFRKAVKKARYIAENGSDRHTSVAKALKRIQDAIGEWHDWFCLAGSLNTIHRISAPALSEALAAQVDRHYTAALKTEQSMRGKLFGEWTASQNVQDVTRHSAQAVSPSSAKHENKSA